MNHLVPCPECSRHVRVSELACPFCAFQLDLADTPAPRLPSERLSRAATLAFGATLASATALAACSGTDAPVPVYGAPAAGSAGMSAAGAAGAQGGSDGGAVPVYGAPAGGETGIGTAGAASAGGGSAPVPVYGAPQKP